MSIPKRIVRISKAYLNQVKDRIDAELTERERSLAETELTASPGDDLEPTRRASPRASDETYDTSPDALMRRAEERIAAARHAAESAAELSRALDQASGREGAAPRATEGTAASTRGTITAESDDPNASDYRILGVAVGSDLAAVQAAYEKLARRCDPRRFPDGSTEQREAERILVRVNAAYDALRKRLDPTENRFGKLELE